MAEFWYNVGKARMWHGHANEIDIINDVIVIIALETDDEDTDEATVGTLLAGAAAEVTSGGYVGGFAGAGRLSLAARAIAVDQVNNRAEFDCGDITWAAITRAGAESWESFVIADELVNDAGSYLLSHLEPAGVPLIPNGSDIKITINAEGLLHLT